MFISGHTTTYPPWLNIMSRGGFDVKIKLDFLSEAWYTIEEAFIEGMKSGLMETEERHNTIFLLTIIPPLILGDKYGVPVGGECVLAAFSTKNRAKTYLEKFVASKGQDILHWDSDTSENFAFLEEIHTGEYSQVSIREYPLNKRVTRKF